MATYTLWNNAIAQYFTANVPPGSGVFLTLNDDALKEIAANFLDGKLAQQEAATDFVRAVCAQVVSGNAVTLATISGAATGATPRGVAFLGLMVLAAHRMAGDEEINPNAYFIRLTQLLGVPTGIGNRPAGLGVGDEEVLWTRWNQWLQRHGWQPTARPGPDGTRKYLNYVLTQALVRDDDKTYLQKRFRENLGAGGIKKIMDEVQLAGWLQRTGAITRRYLREGFRSSDPRRAAAFYEAAYRVFEALPWEGGPVGAIVQRSRVINAGLIRSVSLSGQVSYRMFVPQPTNWIPKTLTIHVAAGSPVRLNPGRPGHFQPLGTQPPFVQETIRLKLDGDPLLDAVVFPKRDFWILTPDPEDPTGAFATWEKFPNLLGQKFTLLCSTEGDQFVQEEMEKFRDAQLLNWDNGPQSIPNMPLHEYRGCMILSSAWEGVVPSDQCIGLFEALKPKQFATISLSGGIRAPGQNAWLVGTPPKATLYGFEEQFGLRLLSGDEVNLTCPLKRQEPLGLDAELPAGIYTLEADWNGQVLTTRSFRLITWEEMDAARSELNIGPSIPLSTGTLSISGALLLDGLCGKAVQNA
jgi:hypothetical protein